MSLDSAFWIWNLVGNIAFSERYGTARASIIAAVDAAQADMRAAAARMETDFVALYAVDPAAAVELMTTFVVETGEGMTKKWRDFWFCE